MDKTAYESQTLEEDVRLRQRGSNAIPLRPGEKEPATSSKAYHAEFSLNSNIGLVLGKTCSNMVAQRGSQA
jgi:hypothetical protein